MHTRNTRLEQEHGVRLRIRVGLHTGLTVIGDIGAGQKHELLALGEAPNIAARLQSLAAPDTVVISADTYRLVEGYFTVEDLGRQTLKGVADSLQVYRVLRHSGAQSRLDVVGTRGLTPLVGREQEVGLLLERWRWVPHSFPRPPVVVNIPEFELRALNPSYPAMPNANSTNSRSESLPFFYRSSAKSPVS